MTVEVCYTIYLQIMLISRDWRDLGLLLMRVAKTIILPLWGLRGITSWSLLAFGGGNFA